MKLHVELLDWDAARARARPIRYEVFVQEQGVPVELEWDEADAGSLHALACDDAGQAVGTGRLLPDGHIGRMAVRAAWRGQGVGAALLAALLQAAGQRGMTRVVLNAQTRAAAFYGRYGFVAAGEEYLEAGIPHVTMSRRLPGTDSAAG